VSKFVGKFRKNESYNDDYQFDNKKRHRNEHSESKRIISRMIREDETYGDSHGSKEYRLKRREYR
jgi:hypothetical protein